MTFYVCDFCHLASTTEEEANGDDEAARESTGSEPVAHQQNQAEENEEDEQPNASEDQTSMKTEPEALKEAEDQIDMAALSAVGQKMADFLTASMTLYSFKDGRHSLVQQDTGEEVPVAAGATAAAFAARSAEPLMADTAQKDPRFPLGIQGQEVRDNVL